MQSSKIQWTDDTHNFWRGCTKVSPGCLNCYAERLVTTRLGGQWGKGKPRDRSKNFNAPLRWQRQCERTLLHYPDACARGHRLNADAQFSIGNNTCPAQLTAEGKFDPSVSPCGAPILLNVPLPPRRVFSLSLGDWLDPEVETAWLRDMLHVIFRCPNLTWQLVTKRPELFFHRLWLVLNLGVPQEMHEWLYTWVDGGHAPKNVWIIASAENQEQLDRRVPALLTIPALIHGLSCEPLLGPLDFRHCLGEVEIEGYSHNSSVIVSGGIEWVIVGGESGPQSRPCRIHWIRSIVHQCQTAKVPIFVKQLGGNLSDDDSSACARASGAAMADKKGGDWTEWPADLRIRQFPS